MNGNQGNLMFDGAPAVNLAIGINAKKCTKCEQIKHFNEFWADNRLRDKRMYLLKNPTAGSDYSKRWRAANRDRHNKNVREWRRLNKGKAAVIAKKSAATHYEKRKENWKSWVNGNPERRRAIQNRSNKKKRSSLKGKIGNAMSTAIYTSLVGRKQGRGWESLAGYTVHELKSHLEQLFKDGMNWDNYGMHGWHIDHKIPIAAFNFEKAEDADFKRCWALKNLQPLWAIDNWRKRDSIIIPHQPSLLIGTQCECS